MPCHATAPRGARWFHRVFGSLLCCIHQLTAPLQTGWTTSEGSVDSCGHKLRNQFPQNQLPLPWNSQHSKQTMLCCTTVYTHAPSLLHQSCSLGLILNKSRLAALPQETPEHLEEPVLEKQGDHMQQTPIPILPRRTQTLLAAKPERELHQQWNLTGNSQN